MLWFVLVSFRIAHRFSIGLRSGLWACQGNDSTPFSSFQMVTVLARWTGALSSCGNVGCPLASRVLLQGVENVH